MSKGRIKESINVDEIKSMPGVDAISVEYYNIVPNSMIITKSKKRYDTRGCLLPEPPTRKIYIDIYQSDKSLIRTVNVNWPTNGIIQLKDNPDNYRVKKISKQYHVHYELEAKEDSKAVQRTASMQTPSPYQKSGVTKKASADFDIFGSVSARLERLRKKVKAIKDSDVIDDNFDDKRTTRLGEPHAHLRLQAPDTSGSDGDPVAIDNPLDEGIAKMELFVGNTCKVLGDVGGFKNVSKIIKHSISPQEMQWSDWVVNPMTKFLPSTAVKPIKTWMRALLPSAMMLGMIAAMKHALKDVKVNMPPKNSYIQEGKTGGALGAIEDL